jgi:osmoprotectant transport system ATP-binding protein
VLVPDQPTGGVPIELRKVTKSYPGVDEPAVQELDLNMPAGEIVVLLGPSGCGKTTTMRMINRLIEPTSGDILIGGENSRDIDPDRLRRHIGYVIQQAGLFPHMTVAANIGQVPKMLGWDKARVAERVDELLTLVGLEPELYRDTYPRRLSGGQQQRVGVARALAADPPVLLMDEPFGALDPISRERMQDELLSLQEELAKTIVFVTHDVEEAVKLGDRIAILRQGGVLAQHDTPAEVLGAPASEFVADFVGADRALKRLKVTESDPADLQQPPSLALDLSLAAARQQMDDGDLAFAVVLDAQQRLHGYLARSRAEGDGTVGQRLQRLEAWVRIDDTLKEAFGEMLLYDAGWVAVLDGDDRFLGVLTPDSLYEASRRSIGG